MDVNEKGNSKVLKANKKKRPEKWIQDSPIFGYALKPRLGPPWTTTLGTLATALDKLLEMVKYP